MSRAVDKVQERLLRASQALEKANIPYAIIGGNAVAAWVATVDESAVRNTKDVDMLIRRSDLEAIKPEMQVAGFTYRHVKSVDMFLDGENAKARDAVHIIFANEKVRSDYLLPAPDVDASEQFPQGFRVLKLEELIKMKLTSYRWRDRVHLQDMLEVELIKQVDTKSLPQDLQDRFTEIENSLE